MGEPIQLFIDFYHLRLKIEQEGTSLKIGEKDRRKLETFLRKNTPQIFKAEIQSDDLPMPISIARKRGLVGTLGFYEAMKGISWWSSKDFGKLLWDYFHMQRLTDSYLESKTINGFQLMWLEGLANQRRVSLGAIDSDGRCHTWESIDVGRYQIVEKGESLATWHEVSIAELADAIYSGVMALLKDIIRKCKYPDCGKIFQPSSQGRYKHVFCDDNCRKRDGRQFYYEGLVGYIAEWLQNEGPGYEYKARDLDEYLGTFVRKKYDPTFSLKPHQVGVEFKPEWLNPYLEKHKFVCRRKWKRNQYCYTFEKL